jgi:ABC-type sugar transport system ATPase subunit
MDKNTIYSIKNITKQFAGVIALNNICFDIQRGEILSLVGENGAGKSTLMNILFGVYPMTSGELYFENEKLAAFDSRIAQKKGISMIHQELSLLNALSIAENIFQGRLPVNQFGFIDRKKLYAESARLLNEVGLKDIDPRTLVRDINVSQQQQVEIAKALSLNAKLLILDEPTSSLTIAEAEILHEIMLNLKQKGITMLYISHKLDEILKISDHIAVLRDGELITVMDSKDASIDKMVSCMVGREYSGGFCRNCYKADYNESDVVLEVNNLNIENKVRDVSFKLYKGELLGITGLVGAGRSELLQAIFGADKKKSGEIKIKGTPARIDHTSSAIKKGLALIPEGRKLQSLFLKFTVRENITIVNLNYSALGKWKLIKRSSECEQANKFVNKLHIKTPSLEQRIAKLSGGNQQKVVIARWLLNAPQILFLDEPTQGIDVGAKNEIYEIIDNLVCQGHSIIMVSSEMQETLSLCDRVITMYEGKITGELMHNELSEELLMQHMSNA